MGIEPEKKQARNPEDHVLGVWSRLLVGAVFASLYIATFGPRQDSWFPAILSGVLGGLVIFLLVKEMEDRRIRRLRQRRGQPPVRRKHRRD